MKNYKNDVIILGKYTKSVKKKIDRIHGAT